MGRVVRLFFRLLVVGGLVGGAYFAWISSFGSPAPIDLLPQGAFGVVELHDAEDLARKLSGTRFAATFARSAAREWLERTDAMVAFDSVLSEIGRITFVSPGRGTAFDFIGTEAAVGWYGPTGGDAAAPSWVAGGRLSARAWTVATALRLGLRFGLGTMGGVTREDVAGRTLYSFPGNAGQSLHLFLAGRVLVGGSDRSLVVKAALSVGDASAGVTREPALQTVRGALPEHGEFFVWVRDRSTIPGALSTGLTGRGSVGALLRAGTTMKIDVAAAPASGRLAATTSGTPSPLPGIALLRQAPLFFLTSRLPAPTVLTDLLQTRRRAVAQRSPGTALPVAALQPGSGYAVAITDSVQGGGLFPAPRGLVVIGMASATEAARALPLLFPLGARSASAGGTRALATSESLPLAGEFELWGAAIGSQLIFASGTSLIDAAAVDAGPDVVNQPDPPAWPVSAVASISMDKFLPLLQRWRAPLSGLFTASWPDGPDFARDLGLLAAIGDVRVAAGADDRLDRAAITFSVHDLR